MLAYFVGYQLICFKSDEIRLYFFFRMKMTKNSAGLVWG